MRDTDRPTSMTYWRVAEYVQDELNAISGMGTDMYAALESNDEPGAVADSLAEILKRMLHLEAEIDANIKPLRAVAKALGDVPGIDLS